MLRLVAAALISLLTAFMLNAAVAQPANYGDAMRWYEREAKKGSARAQFLLGMLYERGVPGHGKDLAKAHTWFLKAAEQGHPMAQYKVGASFHFGTGVTADRAQAVSWYRRAAGNGVAEAQHNLAHLLLNGTGTARSPDEAARWVRQKPAPPLAKTCRPPTSKRRNKWQNPDLAASYRVIRRPQPVRSIRWTRSTLSPMIGTGIALTSPVYQAEY